MQGVADGHIPVIGHYGQEKDIKHCQEYNKINLDDAAFIVTALFCVWMIHSIMGMVVEVKQMSTKDKSERKKYMGVCRWESELTARMKSRFPNTVIRYMESKSPNMRGSVLVPLKIPEEKIQRFGCLVPHGGHNFQKRGK